MNKTASAVLADNLHRLASAKFGDKYQSKLIGTNKISNGTLTRLLKGKTSIGMEILDNLSEVFNVDAWVLLVPNIDPKNLPCIASKAEIEAARMAAETLLKIKTSVR